MPKQRGPRVHLHSYSTERSVCGRPIVFPGPGVANEVTEVTCQVCRTEADRWTRQIGEIIEAVGPQIFNQMTGRAAPYFAAAGVLARVKVE